MGLRVLLAGSFLCALLCAPPMGARAQTQATVMDTVIGNALSDGGTFEQLMALETVNGDTKGALIMVQGPDPSKDEYKPRFAFFADKPEWNKFVNLWNQARATPPPAKSATVLSNSTSIGSSLDPTTATMVSVSVNEDATIEIDVIGPDKWPMLFRLRPKDFDEFGKDVATVSDYFGN